MAGERRCSPRRTRVTVRALPTMGSPSLSLVASVVAAPSLPAYQVWSDPRFRLLFLNATRHAITDARFGTRDRECNTLSECEEIQ